MSDVQAEAPSTDAAEQRAIERIAAQAGWKPTDETRARELGVKAWKGDGHIPAQDYLSKRFSALDSLPALRAKADKVDIMAGKLTAIESQLGAASRARLTERMDAAMENNDKDEAKRILQEAERQANAPDDGIADNKVDEEVGSAFIERNPWYGTNMRATKLAQRLIQEAAAEKGQGRWSRERYERAYKDVEQEVRETYPKLFAEDDDDEPEEKPAKAQRAAPPPIGRGARTGATVNDGKLSPSTMSVDQQRAAEQTYVKKPGYSLDDHKKRYCEIVNESA